MLIRVTLAVKTIKYVRLISFSSHENRRVLRKLKPFLYVAWRLKE